MSKPGGFSGGYRMARGKTGLTPSTGDGGRRSRKGRTMTTRLGDLLIDQKTEQAFRAWLDGLVQKQRRAQAQIEERDAADRLYEERYEKLAAIAREWAERHGVIPWMAVQHQAQAAFDTWSEEAGYLDVDQYFDLDADWKESWINVYVARVEEIEREASNAIH
jgi:hypothetical protein